MSLLDRISQGQSPKQRAISETMAALKRHHFSTIHDKMVNAELGALLESISEELRREPEANIAEDFPTLTPRGEVIRGGRIVIITGKSGVGKTRTVEHALRSRPELAGYGTEDDPMEVLPVVAPAPFSLKSLGHEVLRRTGYPIHRDIRETQVWPIVMARLREIGTRILWIDEAQHGDEIRDPEMAQKVKNTFKRILQDREHPVWLILSGTPELSRFAQTDASLQRRIRQVRLGSLSFPSHTGLIKGLITRCIEVCHGLSIGADLMEDETAGRILHAAKGQFGTAVEFVQDAIRECLARNEAVLSVRHFAEVYAARMGVNDPDRNVFLTRHWDAIVVETALYDGSDDEAGFHAEDRVRRVRKGADE